MDNKVDFEKMSDVEIAQFIQDNHEDFGEEKDSEKKAQICTAIKDGTIIERRPYGFAIVHPEGSMKPNGIYRGQSVLWYVYVSVQFRSSANKRNDTSSKFIQELVGEYAKQSAICLLCYGTRRRNFFERCGFSIASQSDLNDHYTMESQYVKGTA